MNMNLLVLLIVVVLFAYFLYSGSMNLKEGNEMAEGEKKNYLLVTGSIHVALAVLVLLVAGVSFKRDGNINNFFRTINTALTQ